MESHIASMKENVHSCLQVDHSEKTSHSAVEEYYFNEEMCAEIFRIAPSDMCIELKQRTTNIMLMLISNMKKSISKRCLQETDIIETATNELTKQWLNACESKMKKIDEVVKHFSINNASDMSGVVKSMRTEDVKLGELENVINELKNRHKKALYMEHKLSQELYEGQAICNKISDNIFKCEKVLDFLSLSGSENNILQFDSTIFSQLNTVKSHAETLGLNMNLVDDIESYPQDLLHINDKI